MRYRKKSSRKNFKRRGSAGRKRRRGLKKVTSHMRTRRRIAGDRM